jgi:Cu(I)/Ag(I) efflux system membrane fusion protein
MFEVIEGLAEGEEIVVSGQFMLDSESRLKEAIAKMLEVRSKGSGERCRRPGYGRADHGGVTIDMDMSD